MTKEQQVFKEAKRAGVCSLLKGNENAEELMQLLLTPQGIEFCTKNNALSLSTFRRFRGMQATRKGIYIDTLVQAKNLPIVVLVGTTVAELKYDDPNKAHKVILIHGAKAKITASGWAVVFVTNAEGTVEIDVRDNAKIL
jgi:hypothetical protein